MKIISTNIGKPIKFMWNGKEETTGIYKEPVNDPIYLTKNDVLKDEVSNRLNHGGFYKACYAFSAEQYPYWKNLYPNLDWGWGMFGENLTLENFDEKKVYLGAKYKVGEAIVQVSQYREPCYKLGYRFGNQLVIKQFIENGYGGTYFSILEEGFVKNGDEFKLLEEPEKKLSVHDLFNLIHSKTKDENQLKIAIESDAIPRKKRELLMAFLK